MTDILDEIVVRRRKDVAEKPVSLSDLKAAHRGRSDFRPFHEALRRNITQPDSITRPDNRTRSDRVAIIAEIKRGSPAKGLFAPDLNPAELAEQYERGQAACLSVLVEPHYFFGSFGDLTAARNACSLPVLQKDFIVMEYQVWECAVYADAMLLIARCLERQELADLYGLAVELGLDVLVEVFDDEDIDKIEPLQFPLIGINHRNLRTMSIDLDRSRQLRSRFHTDQTVIAASGIKDRCDIETLLPTGIQAFLVGESLSRSPDRIALLRTFVEGEYRAG